MGVIIIMVRDSEIVRDGGWWTYIISPRAV